MSETRVRRVDVSSVFRALCVGCALSACAAASACGKDVDLGGSTDAGLLDGGAPAACDPCQTPSDCASGFTCASVASGAEGFCLLPCPAGNECDKDGTCTPVTSVAGARANACVPNGGACTPAPPPTSDGAPLTRCGDLVGPSVTASCHSCSRSSPTCQPNGCYGGWWCNDARRDCQRPPRTCP